MRSIESLENSSTDYQVTRRRKRGTEVQKGGACYGKAKIIRCRTSLCFVITAAQLLQIR
jgi:hypothetical protein